jgi:hypothetical protein
MNLRKRGNRVPGKVCALLSLLLLAGAGSRVAEAQHCWAKDYTSGGCRCVRSPHGSSSCLDDGRNCISTNDGCGFYSLGLETM